MRYWVFHMAKNGLAGRYRAPSGGAAMLLLLIATILTGCGGAQSATVQPSRTDAQPVYVAVGASDAFGVGTADPDRQSWPTVLSEMLTPAVRLVNLGIPGETVSRALANELPIALGANPRIVTIWLGVNDFTDGVSLDRYRQQLTALVSGLRQGTQAQIVVGNLPDLSLLPAFSHYDGAALTAQVQEWNAVIASVCAAQGVGLVDIFAGWNELADHPDYVSSDGLHPSALGAERLATLFDAVLNVLTASQPAP